MPDANGRFKGQGWSRAKEDAYDRVFLHTHVGEPTRPQPPCVDGTCTFDPQLCQYGCQKAVPHEPPHEDLDERADRDEAAGWGV